MAKVRRLADQKRVGHAGTLDPLAEGVLPVLLGRATRLADFIHTGTKTYVAIVQLGSATDTDDAEGSVTSTAPVPPLSRLEDVMSNFHGEILQTPPRYSALNIGGRRAYAVARSGGDVELTPRPVTIHELGLLGRTEDTLTLEVSCSKGTYIRALARDIAAALGTVGHLAALKRTRVGPFTLSDAVTLEDVADLGVADCVMSADRAIPSAPRIQVTAENRFRLLNGQSIPAGDLSADNVWVYDPDDKLVCLATTCDGLLRPRIML